MKKGSNIEDLVQQMPLDKLLAFIDKEKHRILKEYDNKLTAFAREFKDSVVHEEVYTNEYHCITFDTGTINLQFKVIYLSTRIGFEITLNHNTTLLLYTNNTYKNFINKFIKRINDNDQDFDNKELKDHIISIIKRIDAFGKENKWW